MNKISKKDQDPHQIDRDREALAEAAKITSQHFAVGTFVRVSNRRGEVLMVAAPGPGDPPGALTYLLVRWEDGTVEALVPIALNR